MALAEAGYPDVEVLPLGDNPGVREGQVPDPVLWRAMALAAPAATDCWWCWEKKAAADDFGAPARCGHPIVLSDAPPSEASH